MHWGAEDKQYKQRIHAEDRNNSHKTHGVNNHHICNRSRIGMLFKSYISGAFGTGSSGTSWNNRFKVLHLVLDVEYNHRVLLQILYYN